MAFLRQHQFDSVNAEKRIKRTATLVKKGVCVWGGGGYCTKVFKSKSRSNNSMLTRKQRAAGIQPELLPQEASR